MSGDVKAEWDCHGEAVMASGVDDAKSWRGPSRLSWTVLSRNGAFRNGRHGISRMEGSGLPRHGRLGESRMSRLGGIRHGRPGTDGLVTVRPAMPAPGLAVMSWNGVAGLGSAVWCDLEGQGEIRLV